MSSQYFLRKLHLFTFPFFSSVPHISLYAPFMNLIPLGFISFTADFTERLEFSTWKSRINTPKNWMQDFVCTCMCVFLCKENSWFSLESQKLTTTISPYLHSPPFLYLAQGGLQSLHGQKLEVFTSNIGISCPLFLNSITLHGVSIHHPPQ